jgi:hypothetical protein
MIVREYDFAPFLLQGHPNESGPGEKLSDSRLTDIPSCHPLYAPCRDR